MKILRILCILIAVGGLVLCLAEPVMGIIFIAIGIALFLLAGRKKPEPKEAVQPVPEPAEFVESFDHIKLSGYNYYQKELASLLDEKTEEYKFSAKKMAEEYLGRVYEYEMSYVPVSLVPEPDNEFDPNAIAVYCDDMKIGYIPREDQASVTGIEFAEAQIYGGRYKEIDGDEIDYELVTGETPYKAEIMVKKQ